MPDAASNPVDRNDVQGLVRFGYGKLTEACYLLLRIRDAAAARSWLAGAPVSTAATAAQPPSEALQIAFTSAGLRSLGVPGHVIEGFSPEFLTGLAGDESRSRRLGDVEGNAPARWEWGGPGKVPDVLVMLFAKPGKLADWRTRVQGGEWEPAFEVMDCLDTSDLGDNEPFGFRDGISQPEIDWERRRPAVREQVDYTNVVAPGEFVLGYPNEYGKYTNRPLLDLAEEGAGDLPAAEESPGKKDLGRNGTYVVFRQIEQDVRGFWRYLDGIAQSDPEERRRLAEAMVGRHIDGAPLLPMSPEAIPGIAVDAREPGNSFTYTGDRHGLRCPLGAHVRRSNPRTADYANRPSWFGARWLSMLGVGLKSFQDDLIASTRFHRILRRGREYGPGLAPGEAVAPAPPDDPRRGLHFLCINANIARQFEFVQNAWVMSTKFDGLTDESDPLLGNRPPAGGIFTMQQDGTCRVLTGLPAFVTLRGGAYFFLPGIRALRYFARSGEARRSRQE